MRWTVHLDGGPRRVNHAAAVVKDFIYSFGGYYTGGEYRHYGPIDVHMLNTNNLRWSLLPSMTGYDGNLVEYPEVPFQRYGHTAVSYKNKIYLWGGRNDDVSCNILFVFDTKTHTWDRPEVTGDVPGARDGHSACVVGQYMYIFGGFEDDIDQFSCDVHCFDLEAMVWHYIQTLGIPPSFRDFHSSVVINNCMYIFGGRGDKHSPYHSEDEIYCPEIVYLDLKTKIWHRTSTTGNVPVGRRSHSMFVYDDLIYVFGGYNGILKQHFNDMHTFDPKKNRWNLVKPEGKPPSARRRQACLLKGTKMFLFGGTGPQSHNNQVLHLIDNNDMHVLDFKPTLKTLATNAVIENDIDHSCLPKELRWEILAMTTPNSISRQINQSG